MNYTLNAAGDLPVAHYLKVQHRFKHPDESDYAEIQRDGDGDLASTRRKAVNGDQ